MQGSCNRYFYFTNIHLRAGSVLHYIYVIMSAMASQITSHMSVYSTIYSRRRSKKTSKLRITGLCEGNSPVTGEFPAQRACIAENDSIWWRHPDSNWSGVTTIVANIGTRELSRKGLEVLWSHQVIWVVPSNHSWYIYIIGLEPAILQVIWRGH